MGAAGPCRRVVVPGLLKGFRKKISPDGLPVVAKQIAEPDVRLVVEILVAF